MTITDIIIALNKELAANHGTTPQETNEGNCEWFAEEVCRRIGCYPPPALLWDTHLDPSGEFDGVHCFVAHNGRFYDSERPEGVLDWRQLPCFLRAQTYRAKKQ